MSERVDFARVGWLSFASAGWLTVPLRVEVLRVATLEDAIRLRPLVGTEDVPVASESHYVVRFSPTDAEILAPIALVSE